MEPIIGPMDVQIMEAGGARVPITMPCHTQPANKVRGKTLQASYQSKPYISASFHSCTAFQSPLLSAKSVLKWPPTRNL